MLQVICDICKKPIPNAEKDNNYVTYQNRALCIPCYRDFQDEVRGIMEEYGQAEPTKLKYKSYDFNVYKNVFRDTLHEMCK